MLKSIVVYLIFFVATWFLFEHQEWMMDTNWRWLAIFLVSNLLSETIFPIKMNG